LGKAVIYRLVYHPLVAEDIEKIPENLKNRIKSEITASFIASNIIRLSS